MNQTNLNAPPPPPYMNSNNNSGSKKLLTAAAAIIIALLGTNAYLLYNKSQQSKMIQEQTVKLDESDQAKQELEKTVAEANASLDQMKTDNAQLNKLIDEQKAQIASQQSRISGILSNKGEVGKAKAEIAKLKNLVSQYLAEITKLKEDNANLTSQNTQLSTDKANLTENLNKERTAKEQLETAKAEITTQKEKVESENKVLSKKVNAASVIKVEGINVATLEVNDNGKEDKAKKSKNVNRVKICFKATANNVADAGNEHFFVRIISPTGETLATTESGGGKLTTLPKNEQVLYTVEDDVQYDNKDKDVCIKWDAKNINLPKGEYDVEVYNKSYLCGKGKFKIKGNSWF